MYVKLSYARIQCVVAVQLANKRKIYMGIIIYKVLINKCSRGTGCTAYKANCRILKKIISSLVNKWIDNEKEGNKILFVINIRNSYQSQPFHAISAREM